MKQAEVIFSPTKVDLHQQRIASYWNGEPIFPVTMEMDLTQKCTRTCPECPYGAARAPGLTLQMPFLDRLFKTVGPQTPGLILSGGEPTSVPHYPQVLKLAREAGFNEISTISNGTCLHKRAVQDALLEHGTAVRVSLYDWQEGDTESFRKTLGRISDLRRRIDDSGSRLQVGTAILTRSDLNAAARVAAKAALAAGAHWVYFHPFCENWDSDSPRIADQTGVLDFFDALKAELGEQANVQMPRARYEDYALGFSMLHASHFLLQVGADGMVYAGPECKYDEDYASLDLNQPYGDGFLQSPRRLDKLRGINSGNYRYIGTRHRPPMFSDHLERTRPDGAVPHGGSAPGMFMHPSLI